ncbi:aminotransferase class V-fold PLP-dependent enzyme [Profundibacterium mesophilum]|uniref:Alanine-glyoxylate transaminase serine-glyoxylate transaminase serine-pyruvate transaminase n=1 Tax=Profundibacterium mesophilum KAUST100406-0324 TaxID=1037889 RepID=A0A921NSZ4_9RHOB|nr:aminotransferase class V-fold PLP-dependent enzyme [Profundibacterium mesophilum]KAF0677387.1 alanine-glyoxylate transaminase serine-glyoxylate transaminase serine-pyruvate transaminase [Profundibacterium mesophilum KAUST100406-0324]
MTALRNDIDPDGLLEYSVVFTDRSLNHMSAAFQGVMCDLSRMLRDVYGADGVALVPGGGTFAMEAVARQLATDREVMVIRNGWFSYRWSQIFEMGGIPSKETVLMARRTGNDPKAPFAPVPIEEVTARIREERPQMVFAPHVETSSGMILPDDYLGAVSQAVHEVGGLFVLDCIASGCVWVDMKATGVDVLISAPQKGWSASPAAGCVMLSQAALEQVKATKSSSFAADLGKWLSIMETYENGGHAYHATMPTDALRVFRDTMRETREEGFEQLAQAQWRQGREVRKMLAARGIASVAAPGFEAPGVVVSYTDRADVKTGKAFAEQGMQIAAGVPLMVGEGEGFETFRLGLFGLDKLRDVDASLARLDKALDAVF